MHVLSVHPFRAKILFYQTLPQGSFVGFGFLVALQDGALEGDMMKKGRPSLKLTLHGKDDGRTELRVFTALALREVSRGSSDLNNRQGSDSCGSYFSIIRVKD